MAEPIVVEELPESLNISSVNGTTGRVPSTPEGMALAYGSLIVMALIPIFIGSFRSVRYQREQKESGEKPDTMTTKDAAMFPIIASCALFGLYIFFKIFSKEYINLLLTGYFFILGILALTHLLTPQISRIIPASVPKIPFHLLFVKGKGPQSEDILNYEFTSHDLVCAGLCSGIGAWYLLKKHWIANNLLGFAFAVNGIELLHLNNVVTGCILLGGLFFYDIFWVFGTDVMVTVAKSFEAPIKRTISLILLSD